MKFDLNPKNGIPIYVQLKEQIKLAIATGVYKPGVKLPTVRQLAVELKINPNTVSRVYSALEQEGVLATRQGKGTFVREDVEIFEKVVREKNLERLLENFLFEVHKLGYTTEYVQKKITELSKR